MNEELMNEEPMNEELMNAEQQLLERRQWFVRLGRRLTLGAISILSVNLILRSFSSACVSPQSPCQSCGVFKHCGLSKAEESRRTDRTESKGRA
ncbi:MAG: hypothetical protein QGG36_16880 [Pirellulaceae bacterium]|jgi:hypothetical protein|nr:hypothetical protein [Pirellulaceae bacterium]MDP7017483.1 hypothetical protein [Pirellulaceae bacterium]